MWDGGKGWKKAVHMSSCVTYVTKKHFVFVKRTLTYLAVNIIQWRREQDSGGGRGRREDRELGKARVRLNRVNKLCACGQGEKNPCLLMLFIKFWWDRSE